MSVLGHSIARYLGKLGGLYSVELPESLSHEMTELVVFANQGQPNRALLVTDSAPPGAVAVSKWRDILGWRTADDRIFTWKRGHREPDTSFRNVVRPFISARFPGARGGECTLAQLITLGIAELWHRRNRQPVGASFDAFEQTAQWVAGILCEMFEAAGSTPTSHWSDRFLEHWSGMLSDLDAGLAQYASEPDPRHAWELVRVSGLPLPSAIAGGFNQAPGALDAKDWRALGELWEEIVQSFVIPEGGMSLLLSVLDRQAIGAVKTSPWRGLHWSLAANLPPGTPAPIVGRLIFRDAASPTLLSAAIPAYPIAPVPSWWGVTSVNLDDARKHLQEQTPLAPDPSCAGITRVASGKTELFVLNVRSGQLAAAHTAKRWKSRVRVHDVRIRFKEDWSSLHVSILAPANPIDGDAWINPDEVHVTTKGATVESQASSRGPGEQLLVSLQLQVEYTAKIDPASGHIEGSWNPWRSLRVELRVSRYANGAWQAGPPVDAEIELIIPSPFGPTVLVSDSGPLQSLGPDNQDKFTATALAAPAWTADSTPTILLKEEGVYDVHTYDGTVTPSGQQFGALAQLVVATVPVGAATGAIFPTVRRDLDDGVLIGYAVSGIPYDAAVFRVKQRSANLSSGLLSAVRGLPAGRKQPAAEARDSLRGRYQQQVVRALCQVTGSVPNSLYQYVISSADELSEWGAHAGTPSPMFLFNSPAGQGLPGLGSGPSTQLSTSTAWHTFMQSLHHVTGTLGIVPGAESAWLSGLDFSAIGASLVREYVQAHAALVQFARTLDPADAFWASFPFSVLVVEGKSGLSLGQLLAVLLSPLHPARLAWTFAVTVIAKQNKGDAALVQLVEGWNVPWTGSAVNTAGQHRQLVAVPTDPGLEQDFAAWSALAVLGDNNVADLPVFAAGRSLPWGGRTGINAKVVERSIKDYLLVHPHANSLEIDVRSVAPAPRAQEIDEALLELVAAESLAEVGQLGGGTRIWDSADRRGRGPTRDRLFTVRGSAEPARAFEWRAYDAATAPTEADVALIENASVHLGVIEGATRGVLGLLPLRRFAPPSLQGLRLDQNFAPSSGEDLLALSDLLKEIESPPGLQRPALRATPQAQALGIGRNARWEVLGTFNLDPALLSAVVASASAGSDKRLLWEWRPSWMSLERKHGDLARRPYYVVARIPSSLLKALQLRQALTSENALQLLGVLGERGIGLAALSAAAGTQESAAAGFFYAVQLLLSPTKANLAGPALGQRVLGVIPVDPIESILQGLAGSKLKRRADLLAVVLSVTDSGIAKLCFVPVELKHHGMPSAPEPIPAPKDQELGRAREQLADTGDMLRALSEELAGPLAPDAVATRYLKHLALATLVDFGLTFTRNPVDPEFRRRVLGAILSGRVELGVGDAILLWFAPGSAQSSGGPCIVDRYGQTMVKQLRIHEVFLDPSTVPGLWWDTSPAGPNEVQVRAAINTVTEKAFTACTAPPSNNTVDLRDLLAQVLQVNAGPAIPDSSPPPAVSPVLPSSTAPAPDQGPAEAPAGGDTTVPPAATAEDASQAATPAAEDQPSPYVQASETPAAPNEDTAEPAPVPEPPAPRAIIGWSDAASRWAAVGKLANSEEVVALDLDHPKTVGIFGYMGSGKSYLLGNLIESAVEPLAGINRLEVPLAVVVFNYRRNSSDRFELSSLGVANRDAADADRLQREYGATPAPVRNLHVLCLPGELRPERQLEYGTLAATELYFNPHSLSAEDWELLMGEPGSEAVFARTIRNTLVDLRSAGNITLEDLEHQVTTRLTGQSRTAARLRFDFIRRYISEDHGVDFGELLQAGRVLIIDLRQPLFNKDDALRFFLVCANQISKVQGRFNKMLVFDEAHEYMSDAFGDRMEARIRLMRHEGTSYVFATQDVSSIPLGINRFLGTRFVFDLGTRENVQDLEQVAPEFRGYQLLGIRPGSCFVQANASMNAMFSRPREIRVRPRVTEHGGGSRIFTRPPGR